MSAFREVKVAFDDVYDDIVEMNKSLQEMTVKLHNNTLQTKQLLEQTSYLRDALYINLLLKFICVDASFFLELKMIFRQKSLQLL